MSGRADLTTGAGKKSTVTLSVGEGPVQRKSPLSPFVVYFPFQPTP